MRFNVVDASFELQDEYGDMEVRHGDLEEINFIARDAGDGKVELIVEGLRDPEDDWAVGALEVTMNHGEVLGIVEKMMEATRESLEQASVGDLLGEYDAIR